jgi:hypothetical protein
MPIVYALTVAALTIVVVVFLVRRQLAFAFGMLFVLAAVGLMIGLQPSIVQAYPTTFARSPVPYAVDSIAGGGPLYQAHCAFCHGTPSSIARRKGEPPSICLSPRRHGYPRETCSGS